MHALDLVNTARKLGFARLKDRYPWAKAIVICSFWYGRYRIPHEL